MQSKLRLPLTLAMLAGALWVWTAAAQGTPGRRYVARPDASPVIRVAVLPFSASGPAMDASATVTTQVVNYLLATGRVSVVEPGLVKEAYTEVRLMRGDEDLTVEIVQQLAEALQVDVLVVGRIDEWDYVSAGSERFPSVGIHARMVDGRDARILWADSVAHSGKGGFLGSGSINSLNILSGKVARALAKSAERALPSVTAVLAAEPVTPVVVAQRQTASVEVAATPGAPGSTEEGATASNAGTEPSAPVEAASAPPAEATPGANGNGAGHQDPTKRYTNGELAALLVEVPGFERSDPTFGRHQYESVVAKYQQNGVAMEVQLVDYWKSDTAERFLTQRSPRAESAEFEGCSSRQWTSGFGYLHIDVAAGRFGVYLRGPSADKALAQEIATALVKGLVG